MQNNLAGCSRPVASFLEVGRPPSPWLLARLFTPDEEEVGDETLVDEEAEVSLKEKLMEEGRLLVDMEGPRPVEYIIPSAAPAAPAGLTEILPHGAA